MFVQGKPSNCSSFSDSESEEEYQGTVLNVNIFRNKSNIFGTFIENIRSTIPKTRLHITQH